MGQKIGDHWDDFTASERHMLLTCLKSDYGDIVTGNKGRSHLTIGLLPFVTMEDAMSALTAFTSFAVENKDKNAFYRLHVKISNLKRIIVAHG